MQKIFIWGGLILIIFLLLTIPVQSKVEIDVNFKKEPLFKSKNWLPGDSTKKEIRVENEGDEIEDLYLEVDVKSGKTLAKEMKLYLINKSSGKYLIGGSGDRYDLWEADREDLIFVERLEPGESNRYLMKVKLDEKAGNEVNGKKVKFDLDIGFSSRKVDSDTPLPTRSYSGEIAGSKSSNSKSSKEEDSQEQGEVTSEDSQVAEENNKSEVAGDLDKDDCESWPMFIWIIFGALFIFVSYHDIVAPVKRDEDPKLVGYVIALAMILVLWFVYDKCRVHDWFPVLIILTAVVNYVYYLKESKKSDNSEN